MLSILKALIGKSIKAQMAYRSNLLLRLFSSLLMLYIQVTVWQALYAQGQQGTATLAETLTYLVVSSLWLTSLRIYPGERIAASAYSGDIATDLMRPVSPMLLGVGYEIGTRLFALATTIPVTLVALFTFGIMPPASPAAFLAFLTTALLGSVLFTLYNCIIGYAAFWLVKYWFMSWFEEAFFMLFGGTRVPLWFYPAWLYGVANVLPFKYITYVPIELYLGRMPAADVYGVIGMQLLWIAVLFGLERLVWHRAQRRIVVNGG